jgi:hypothetical protein
MKPEEQLEEWLYSVVKDEDPSQWEKHNHYLRYKKKVIEVWWSSKSQTIHLGMDFRKVQLVDVKYGLIGRLGNILRLVEKRDNERDAEWILGIVNERHIT